MDNSTNPNEQSAEQTPKDIRTTIAAVIYGWLINWFGDIHRKLNNIIPGWGDALIANNSYMEYLRNPTENINYTLDPQEWLRMALYGQHQLDMDPGEAYEICQGFAETFFANPRANQYEIPNWFYQTDMGAYWHAAYVRCANDQLITSNEAATQLGIDRSTISRWISSGKLQGYRAPNSKPSAPGSVLVRQSDVDQLKK